MQALKLVSAALVSLCWCSAAAAQAKVEERVYRIRIEDREAGRYTQKITTYADGTTDLEARADVKVKILGFTYQYAYRANERWKENRLLHIGAASNENGEQRQLLVSAEGNQLKVKAGAKERLMSGDAWSTSYWLLPPADRRGKPMLLVDADSGEEHRVQLQVVGQEKIPVGTQTVPCTHYRVTGLVQADLWFDAKDRLVRREMMRKSRKTYLELLSVTVQ